MSDLLRARVKDRLAALEINPFEAARRANFERSFVNDLLIGKKSTIRQKKMVALAKALECDPEYLTGLQGTPKIGGSAGGLGLAGIVEANTWRKEGGFIPPPEQIPLAPDPRYPAHLQSAYIVRGDHAVGLGINDGAVITVFAGEIGYRDGDIVVARQRRGNSGHAEIELTIRCVAGGALSARPPAHTNVIDPIPLASAEIVGLVLSAHRVFGPAA